MEESFIVEYTVASIIYKDNCSDFYILKIEKVKFQDKSYDKLPSTYVVKGNFSNVSKGDTYSSHCIWTKDKRGYQLKALISSIVFPQNINGIRRFLTKTVKGLSKTSVDKIVSTYGINSLDKIRESKENLLKIKGIGEKTANRVYNSVLKHQNLEKLSLYLLSKGITNYVDIVKLYEELGVNALDRIIANPYSICDYVNISRFPIADKIALASGYDVKSLVRLEKIVLYYITTMCNKYGDMYIALSSICENIDKFLSLNGVVNVDISKDDILSALESLSVNNKVKIDTIDGEIIVYLSYLYDIEVSTSEILSEVNNIKGEKISCKFFNDFFDTYSKNTGIIPEERQKDAVINALNYPFSIVTGGAGTGKTQTINIIISAILHKDKNTKIALCSPTGRASKRMSEVTGREAFTIHRFLGIYGEKSMQISEIADIDADYVICDEGSMVDFPLFYKLLSAIKKAGASFIFVGDKDQLPPVGIGSPFKDLVNSNCVPTTTLRFLFRQAKESQINYNANIILDGSCNKDTSPLSCDVERQDFFCFHTLSSTQTHNIITNSIKKLIELGNKADDIVVLSSMKKTDYGTMYLNSLIQELLNPSSVEKSEHSVYPYILRVGDRVMQTTNNYELDVFNGDVGYIESIDNEEEEYVVIYDDYVFNKGVSVNVPKRVIYNSATISELTLAYAITVHKAQGSEYPCVIMPIAEPLINISKNILYTAITRAKKRFVAVGNINYLYNSLKKEEVTLRNTKLKERLLLLQ